MSTIESLSSCPRKSTRHIRLWLDRDLFNNSYTVKPDNRATKKLSNILGFASEWIAQLLAWLA